MNIPPGGPREFLWPVLFSKLTPVGYKSMLGAGIDDKTSYHPLFDFDGKDRTDRPDCLFCLKRPHTRHAKPAPGYLVWDDMVIIDYQRQPVRALALPLSISSKIGQEGARLEAMLRFNPGIEWEDILARILYRGTTHTTAKKVQNKLNMNAGRFRIDSRLLAFGIRVGNRTLETYLLSIMTPEMVAKNTTKGLVDLLGRDEANFVSLLNRDIDIDESKDRINNRRTPQALKREAHRIRDLKHILKCAHKWAQAQLLWEDQHPIPAPSIYGETTCDAVESIIAFKLGSMTQYRCNGELAVTRHFRLDSAAPSYRFDSPMMEKFFGSWAQQGHLTSQNLSDPYGLLGNPPDDEAQKCLIDFLLEPARSHYRASTLVDDGSEEYRPIFLTDPNGSYWEQLQELQNAFERHWAEVGRMGPPPILHGLLKLDYDSMTWNSHDVPALSLVWQTIDSVTRTFVIWQRQQAESQRTKLCKLQRKFEHDEAAFQRLVQQQGGSEENGEGTDAEGGQDDLAVEEEEGDGDDAEMEADAGAEDLTEVDTEEEEEL